MPLLNILLGIVVLISLVLALRVNLNIVYEDELKVFLRILFVKIRLYPARKKKYKHKDKKKSKKDKPTYVTRKSSDPKPKNLIDNIKLITDVISEFFKAFSDHLHVKLAKIYIKVATPDAAQTAILYGLVGSAVECLVAVIDSITNLQKIKDHAIIVEPDFLSDKPRAQINITLSSSGFGAIRTLIKTFWTYTKLKNKNSK